MKRNLIVSIVVLAAIIAAFVSVSSSISTASADGRRQIRWKVEWGQKDNGSWITKRSLSSNIATRLYEQAYFVYVGTSSSVVYDVGTNPIVHLGSADPASLWQTGNYQIGDEGVPFSLVGTNWASGICLPGPTFDIVFGTTTWITVTNTTTRTIFAQLGGATGFVTIEPSQTLQIGDQSSSGHINLQVERNLDSWNRCADLSWGRGDLPTWATATPTPTPTATATPSPTVNEVKDVRTSNVTDSSVTVSFLTKYPAVTYLWYWREEFPNAVLARDFRVTPGETHSIQIDALGQGLDYQYQITTGGNNSTVYTGTFKTALKGDLTTPRIAFGQVTDQIGHPVYGALVYLTENGKQLLSAVSDTDGWWSTDLNAARPQTSGSFRALGGGPASLIRIEATAGSLGSAVATVPTNFDWPLSLNLRPVVTRTVTLGTAGWNTFAFPLEPIGVGRVSDLARILNGDGVNRLASVYRYSKVGWQGSIVSGTVVLGEDLPLLVGEGYFFQMDSPFKWNLRGFTVTQVIPLYLGVGWNLVGVPNPSGLTASDLSDVTGVISGTTTYNVHEVDRWIYGRYEGHRAGYPFNNFPIDPDRAYFLRVNRAGRLDPGTGFVPLQ